MTLSIVIQKDPICEWVANILCTSETMTFTPLMSWPLNMWIPVPTVLPTRNSKCADVRGNMSQNLLWDCTANGSVQKVIVDISNVLGTVVKIA
jgi:hypothetical protein